jgi:hypothetical protein
MRAMRVRREALSAAYLAVFVALEIGKQDPRSVVQQDLVVVAEPEEIEEEVWA